MIELTIGIPTANRPDKIQACLDSIKEYLTIQHKIIVVDSSEKGSRLDKNYMNGLAIIQPPEMVSPSHARKIISDNLDTEFLLYLDDDMTITKGSVEKMMEFLKSNDDADIVGGAVNEYGYWRDIGFHFLLGEVNKIKIIEKKVITKEWLDYRKFESFKVDLVTQPPFLMRASVFSKVSFDPNYKWAKEIYDFFYDCYLANMASFVLPNSIFKHFPNSYSSETFKHKKKIFNKEGNELFSNKWGIRIQNPKKQSILKMAFDKFKYRVNKRRMVNKKFKLDQV
jgi:glycosyltransferase involved in cell wall biosynthesis